MVWDDKILINWMDITQDDGILPEKLPGDRMVIVRKGVVELLVDGNSQLLYENEIAWLDDGCSFSLAPALVAAEIFELYWPSAGIDHSHNDAPFPVGDMSYGDLYKAYKMVSMMRPWEKYQDAGRKSEELLPHSLEHCHPVNIKTLQYCHPDTGPWSRIVLGKRGHVCFQSFSSDESHSEIKAENGEFHLVLAGAAAYTLNDSTITLNENDLPLFLLKPG